MDMEALGAAIEDARERCGISRADMALRAGVTQPYITSLEKGRVNGAPSVPYLRAMADAIYLRPDKDQAERYELRAKLLSLAGHHQASMFDAMSAQITRDEEAARQGATLLAEKISGLAPDDTQLVEGLVDRLLPEPPRGSEG